MLFPSHDPRVNTSGAITREISIEAILPRIGGCTFADFTAPNNYDSLIDTYYAGLTAQFGQVFVNTDTKTWSPKDGRFTWTKSWTVGDCS